MLITGGSRGLGLALARACAAQGARLVICGRDPETLERARADLAGRGADVLAVRCDVTDFGQVQALVREARARFGRIDVLVNNAGIVQVGPLDTMTLADWEAAIRTNFWGPLYATLAVLPEMRARREGRIVNIASIGGKLAVPHVLPYAAGKFALVGLSEGLAAELARDGIVVTTVCPGLMRTGGPRHAIFKGRHRAEHAWFNVSDSLPLISIDAERAARRIVAACRRGDAELDVSLPASIAARVHGLAPGLTARLLGVVNRLLPRAGGIGTAYATGGASRWWLVPAWLTALGERAARELNQVA